MVVIERKRMKKEDRRGDVRGAALFLEFLSIYRDGRIGD
jgi:hypothetical protein